MSSSTRVYFPSLNGVRAIAAFLVIFRHLEFEKAKNNLFNFNEIYFFKIIGGVGVTLFFVLSGFLITYLLLKEIKITSKVNVKLFYMRRILRIWPLYFFIILLTVLFELYLNEWHVVDNLLAFKLFLYTFFLPNVANIIFGSKGFPSQLWSVGTEEQFYLLWPHFLKYKIIKSIKTLVIFVLMMLCLKLLFLFLDNRHVIIVGGVNVFGFMPRFLELFRIDCMAIGGIGSFLFFEKEKYTIILSYIYKSSVQIFFYCLIVSLLLFEVDLGVFQHMIFSIAFCVVLLNLATNEKSIFNLENSIFNFLGKISYGLYVYHPLILLVVMKVFKDNFTLGSVMFSILYSLVVIILTVIVSVISYKYLETPFLTYKHKFSTIISGNEIKD